MSEKQFDEHHILHELKHYLPSQTPLKDFIHHNSLHAFQHMKFYNAIFKASKIFGYQATLQLDEFRTLYETGRINDAVLDKIITERKGKNQLSEWKQNVLFKKYDDSITPRIGMLRSQWKEIYHLNLDNSVQPFLFRILAGYLDQGISIWEFPHSEQGFLAAIRALEKNSFTSFFKTGRAKKLLHENITITDLLKIIVGNESYFNQYIFDQQFSHRGWSGMVATIEERPDTLFDTRIISLNDVIILELLLEIDTLDDQLGKNWQPLSVHLNLPPVDLFEDVPVTELQEVFKILQDAFEWSYYDVVLSGILLNNQQNKSQIPSKSFQAIFCIDERECSIRRNIETADPECETFGCPGFFGVEFYFQPQGAKFYDKLCPAPVTPKYLIKETNVERSHEHETLYTQKTHTFLTGYFSTFILGLWSAVRLLQHLFKPKMSPAISNAFAHMHKEATLTIENKDINDIENNLQVGFTVDEMAARVNGLLKGIGLIKDFASVIYVVGHGSSSANNPHHGAHDCGACSGRPGSVNARVFAFMANHPKVRECLQQNGITIPETTQFVGALHDTAADRIEYYDTEILYASNKELHKKNSISFEYALDLNAKERSRRFASINTKQDIKKIRKAILDRSVSLFEPRPELGHGTNTLCIVGERKITRGLFLDRRAFLNSYNYKTDLNGELLTGVMRPLGPVCGGINLEYYFSRVDNQKLGAGTKLPHNVMGLFGVANSSDGDLRPGLPWQMIEVHDPVRLLIIVEHYPEIVLMSIQSSPEMYEWYINEWVHVAAIHPETNTVYYFQDGVFKQYHPFDNNISTVNDVHMMIENATEMETNNIVHATQENMPVYLHK
ncbi:MAG: DUF2309 domain-containing protein [Sphingobacteriales bacterium]|nr:DUF2309 domain-containing protein [Sphingobacteriales bacterium]